MKNRNDILNDLLAYAREKGYNEYAYGFGVLSTYLTEDNLADLEKYVARWRVEDGEGI
jgi:hypothetical protein